METKKLYYEDCHLWEFSATVTGCTENEKGWLVTLDATAFYPEGGGQACDVGTLGDAVVLDVQQMQEDIVHLCDKPLEVGSRVTGRINGERRFDLMQQHAGEHIVSGVIYKKYGYQNVGFHVGADVMEIDFDGIIPPEDIPQIETLANQAVWQNLPIRCYYPSPEELPHVFYRTKKALPWPVRIVEIPGVDSCACCGVHVAYTGEIGVIKLISCVKLRRGVRIEMSCGGRAWRLLQTVFEQNRQVSNAFSARLLETGQAARKMNEALAAEKLRANTLQAALLEKKAEAYAGKGNTVCFEEGLTPNLVRDLADRIAGCCGGWAAVFSGEEGNYSVCIVNKDGDVKALGAALAQELNGRGGGKTGCFQGSVRGKRAEIQNFFSRNAQ